jgi:AcrR family transcriptional regulator
VRQQPDFAKTVRSLLRDQLLNAAAELTCADGWANVTMGKVAASVGVSRQTVYKELGSKPELAEALILEETDRFAAGIAEMLEVHPADPVEGIAAAIEYTLATAMDKPLLKAVLSGPYGDAGDLLPLLTTRSDAVLARSVEVITPMLAEGYPAAGLTEAEWAMCVETFVRLILSHLVQPTMPVARAVGQMRWVVARMLRG